MRRGKPSLAGLLSPTFVAAGFTPPRRVPRRQEWGRVSVLLGVSFCLAGVPGVQAEDGGSPVPAQESATAVLRVARSGDGVHFVDTGEVVLPGALAPDMVRLPNDRLLAVFDYHDTTRGSNASVLAVSQSTNEGRTWSRPQPIRLRGVPDGDAIAAHADLLIAPDGLVRMYFAVRWSQNSGQIGIRQGGEPAVASAVTRDGVVYHLDPEAVVDCVGFVDPHPSSAVIGRQTVLLIADSSSEPRRYGENVREVRSLRLISQDGRHFRAMRPDGEQFPIGNMLPLRREAVRMFYVYSGDLFSLVSPDAVRWQREAAMCLKNASDAAVVSLRNGTYLMLYTGLGDRASAGRRQLMTASEDGGDTSAEDGAGFAGGDEGSPGALSWEPFSDADIQEEINTDDPGSSTVDSGWDSELSGTFAPRADLHYPVDYLDWLENNMLYPEQGNAWESYGPLLEQAWQRPDWDGLANNMLGSDYNGPAIPWDPKDFPEWEASYQATLGLLGEFNQATLDPAPFSIPLSTMFPDDGDSSGIPDDRQLLVNMLLPSLADMRGLNKGVISNAWRAENGQVDPDAMREAFGTVLRSAHHTGQGASLIEGLVSIALETMAYEHARLALEYNVFRTPDEISATLDQLRSNDFGEYSMADKLAGEHAVFMDTLQYLCEPDEPGGEPYIHQERVDSIKNELFGWRADEDGDPEWMNNLDVETVQEAIEVGDEFYRELADEWSVGYPTVRVDDLNRLGEDAAGRNPILKDFVPSLGRVYELQTRSEAGRRATEVTYVIHLFKARYGRWPGSLDELPIDYGDECRTDPFTGEDFIYRLTDEGFTLYSRYDNNMDDGGLHNSHGKTDDPDESDDFVFWPTPK